MLDIQELRDVWTNLPKHPLQVNEGLHHLKCPALHCPVPALQIVTFDSFKLSIRWGEGRKDYFLIC